MHISIIIHSLTGGGAERVTSHMAEYWSEKGHQVTVITIASTNDNRYKLPARVELKPLGIDGLSNGPISGLLNNVSRIKTLRQAIKHTNPDVCISMMATANVMTALACLRLPVKCIGSERNYPGIDYTGRLWGLLRKYTYRFVNIVITQTKISEQWIRDNTNAKQVTTIPNPLLLPLPRLEPVIVPQKKPGRKLILGVGRLTDQKQFHHLIQAFSEVAATHTDWDLAIVGEGENRLQLEELIEVLQLTDRAHLIGRAGNISDWYEAADIFTMSSLTEGFPNALIEAMAHSVPCISYNCLTGPGEIIEDRINGLLVEANNTKELTGALNELMASEQLRTSISGQASNIVPRLDPEIVMGMWEDEIRKLVSR